MPGGNGRKGRSNSRRAGDRATKARRVARLADLDGCVVAGGEPDPRGWHVLTRESARPGEVADLLVDLQAMTVCYLEVELDKDALRLREARRVLVPTNAASLNDDEEIVRLGVTTAELLAVPAYDPRSLSRTDQEALRRRYARYLAHSEAELATGMRRRMGDSVQVRKRVGVQDHE